MESKDRCSCRHFEQQSDAVPLCKNCGQVRYFGDSETCYSARPHYFVLMPGNIVTCARCLETQ